MSARLSGTAMALVASLLAPWPAAPAHSSEPRQLRAEVRVNQQGWLPGETKIVSLLASRPLGRTSYVVLGHRTVLLRGMVPAEDDVRRAPEGIGGQQRHDLRLARHPALLVDPELGAHRGSVLRVRGTRRHQAAQGRDESQRRSAEACSHGAHQLDRKLSYWWAILANRPRLRKTPVGTRPR